jgi:alpha-amylase
MHKKMIHVRNKLIQIEEFLKNSENAALISVIEPEIADSWDEIYKAQCNDCYWHGMFGGVYLQFLRFSVYTHLINAEKKIDEMNATIFALKDPYLSVIPVDFNKDSKIDILIESTNINAYVDPSEGGTLFELDFKPKSYNLLNTLTRWHEAYHDKKKLHDNEFMIDRYRRSMLRMRFLHSDVTLDQLEADTYYEFGDFINGEFEVKRSEKETQTAIIELEMDGSVKDPDTDDRLPCTINKTIMVEENNILVKIDGNFKTKITAALGRILDNIYIAVDLPFFFNGDTNKFKWESTEIICETELEKDLLNVFQYVGSDFKAYDETYDLTVEMRFSSTSDEIKIYKFPINAFVHTDDGYRTIYQGINVTPRFKLSESFEIEIQLKID